MSNWLHTLNRIASSIEGQLDAARYHRRLRDGRVGPIEIQAYRGHGTPHMLYLKGRVLEHRDTTSAGESDGVWDNIVQMYRRFASREIPGARLHIRAAGTTFEALTDDEGYFDLRITPAEPLPQTQSWHEVDVELLEPLVAGQGPVRAVGHVLVPSSRAAFGIISDIDDTIIQTGAADPLTMARIVVLNNPHTRLPFEGVAAFYQALQAGGDGAATNPLFYVSSSPWNLYDLLIDFMNINSIPLGPLFLRDIGLEPDHWIKSGHREHKITQLRTILDTHAPLPFVLIGDSGQEDPEIYREIVQAYPGRIKTIYIRDVTLEERATAIRLLVTDLRSSGVELVLAADTVAAATHAAAQGLIVPAAVALVRAKKHEDKQAPTVADQLPLVGDGSTTEP